MIKDGIFLVGDIIKFGTTKYKITRVRGEDEIGEDRINLKELGSIYETDVGFKYAIEHGTLIDRGIETADNFNKRNFKKI